MQDDPTPPEILAAVAELLRSDIVPKLEGSAAFQVRVAANAIDLVRRQIQEPIETAQGQRVALGHLLGERGEMGELCNRLARRIADGEIGLETPGLEAFLWSHTEAKLAVDQPNYAGLARARALRRAKEEK